jgi:CheY-like chemotaxis protein
MSCNAVCAACRRAGAEALAKAEAARPDGALLDLDMPGLSGAEVARRLHGPGAPRPWLFLVSGLGPSSLSREDAAVFHARLAKPVHPGDLLELIQAAEAALRG